MDMREKLINEIVNYFKSNQWKTTLEFLQNPEIAHFHVYIDTSIHPYKSLQKIIEGYLKIRGWPIVQPIDPQVPNPSKGICALHNIRSHGKPHWDLNWRFNPNVVLSPMTPIDAERNRNVLAWGVFETRTFIEQFPWSNGTKEEIAEIKDYFNSKHWKQGLNLVLEPSKRKDIVPTRFENLHVHINIETRVHPVVIQKLSLEALAKEGWEVDHAVLCIFYPMGHDSGKIVFLCTKPQVVFDIAFVFNPDVIIRPSTVPVCGYPHEIYGHQYDVWTRTMEEEVMKKANFLELTDEEINTILNKLRYIEEYDPYCWKIIQKKNVIT